MPDVFSEGWEQAHASSCRLGRGLRATCGPPERAREIAGTLAARGWSSTISGARWFTGGTHPSQKRTGGGGGAAPAGDRLLLRGGVDLREQRVHVAAEAARLLRFAARLGRPLRGEQRFREPFVRLAAGRLQTDGVAPGVGRLVGVTFVVLHAGEGAVGRVGLRVQLDRVLERRLRLARVAVVGQGLAELRPPDR